MHHPPILFYITALGVLDSYVQDFGSMMVSKTPGRHMESNEYSIIKKSITHPFYFI